MIKVNGWKLLSSVNRNAGQATDNLRNSDILIQLCDYRVCAVVSTKQWFSIGGGKHSLDFSLLIMPKCFQSYNFGVIASIFVS